MDPVSLTAGLILGIISSLIANYLTGPIDNIWSKFNTKRKQRTQKSIKDFQDAILWISNNEADSVLHSLTINRMHIRSTQGLILSLATVYLSFYFFKANDSLPFKLIGYALIGISLIVMNMATNLLGDARYRTRILNEAIKLKHSKSSSATDPSQAA